MANVVIVEVLDGRAELHGNLHDILFNDKLSLLDKVVQLASMAIVCHEVEVVGVAVDFD